MRPNLIKSLRGLLKDMASFPPLKLALWCLVVFALCILVVVVVGGMWFLGRMGYGPEFFITLMKSLGLQ